MRPAVKNIDAYIKQFTPDLQTKLEQLRLTIAAAAPLAREAIKYGMPTFVGNKNLIHFAWCKTHIGLYPTPSAIQHFHKELSIYKTSKWAVQIPWDQKLPLKLIAEITKFRVQEDMLDIKKKKTT